MKEREITVQALGCGDAFGSGGLLNACFHVKAPQGSFLMDCGATSLVALKKYGISTADPDFIFISHFHGDHFGGLPFIFLDAALISRRTKPLTIITPPGGRKRIEELAELLYPGSSETFKKLEIRYMEYLPETPVELGWLKMEAFPVVHTPAASPHGLRISIGEKIFSYSGDTEWTDNLIPLSAKADLFICECCFYEKEVKAHLSYKKLQEKKELLTCKKILLTHMDTDMLNHREALLFHRAEEGQLYTL